MESQSSFQATLVASGGRHRLEGAGATPENAMKSTLTHSWLLVAAGICVIAMVVLGVFLSGDRDSPIRMRASCGEIVKYGVEENGCWKWTQGDLTHICCID